MIGALKQIEAGRSVEDVAREQGLRSPINPRSFFTALHAKWGVGTPNYVQNMTQSAQIAQMRMNCS